MLPSLIEASQAFESSSVSAINETASSYDVNMSPVIGIVTQPLAEDLKKDPRFEGKSTYLMQAYVDFMESAGARVIPIIMNDWS